MPKKKLNRSQLTKKLDRVFSQFIRLRDSVQGYCVCITCGAHKHWKEIHAGHFVKRGCILTRWHKQNVHGQCCGCNTYREGEQAKYLVALEQMYGREVVDELMELEKKYRAGDYKKPTLTELREKIEYYRTKVKELETYS